MTTATAPPLPDYRGACVSNIVPTLLAPPPQRPEWMPAEAFDADRVVLFVVDGLGWNQLQERAHLAPMLASMSGGPIATVVPTTTASALTSIAVGVPPGEHGVVGYRIATHSSILNVLRWSTPDGDARRMVEPTDFQPVEPFLGHRPPIVTKAEFADGGFTSAHLRHGRWHPWRVPSTLIAEVVLLARSEEPFVYAYYDGLDKVAHERGLRIHYDAEMSFVDRLVVNIFERLPEGTALLVTADHGQVHTGDQLLELAPPVLDLMAGASGEARFRWLHARPGRAEELLAAATEAHADDAWVVDVDAVVGGGWLGPRVTRDARERLGDVAVVPRERHGFVDPADTGPIELIGRHGGLSDDELLVPLVAAVR